MPSLVGSEMCIRDSLKKPFLNQNTSIQSRGPHRLTLCVPVHLRYIPSPRKPLGPHNEEQEETQEEEEKQKQWQEEETEKNNKKERKKNKRKNSYKNNKNN